jgi:hypothetical protein
MSGEAFFTMIPSCCTSGGSCGWAIAHILHAVDLFFDRRGDSLGDGFGVGAGVGSADGNRWRRDLRVLGDWQREHRDRARDYRDNRNDDREDRTVNKEMCDLHWRAFEESCEFD